MSDKWDAYVVDDKEDKWSQYEVKQPEKMVGSVFGKVSESDYKKGKRNIMGNVFERPGAAIRSAIQGKGYVEGAVNPTNVPKFQDQILNAYYKNTPNFPFKQTLGNIPSVIGLAADTLTEPANLIPMVAGMSPTVQRGMKAVSQLEPAQAFARFLNKEREVVNLTKHMPKIMTDNWLVNKAKNVKSAVDESVQGLKNQFKTIFEPHNNTAITPDKLKAIPQSLLDDIGITKEGTTVGQLWDARDNLLTQINDVTWNKSDNLKRLKLKEEDLTNAVERIKSVVLNNVPPETRKALLDLDPKYTEVMHVGKKLLKTVYEPSTDTYKTSSLVNVYKGKTNAGAREAFERFRIYNDKIGQVSKDIKKYVGRQNTKAFMKKWGGRGAILLGAEELIRRPIMSSLESQRGG
jgi:hypothetical protein